MHYEEKVCGDGMGEYICAIPDDYVVVDIETTGLDPYWDEIIEIGAIRVQDGEETERFSRLIRPRRAIPSFITSLTGISNAMVAGEEGAEEVLPAFAAFAGDSILLGHNTRFDVSFLARGLEKLGIPFPNPFMDTMRIGRKLLKEEGPAHFKLEDLARWYGISYRGAHRAVNDCAITKACYDRLMSDGFARYGNEEDLLGAIGGTKIYGFPRAKEIACAPREGTIHPLAGHKIAFTGNLSACCRRTAMEQAALCGAVLSDSVTASTRYLVVGSFDRRSTRASGKLRKAEELHGQGKKNPVILDEDAFLTLLAQGEGQE